MFQTTRRSIETRGTAVHRELFYLPAVSSIRWATPGTSAVLKQGVFEKVFYLVSDVTTEYVPGFPRRRSAPSDRAWELASGAVWLCLNYDIGVWQAAIESEQRMVMNVAVQRIDGNVLSRTSEAN